MSVLTEFDPMVLEFFSECGVDATYSKVTQTYDPTDGDMAETSVTWDVQAIVLDLSLQSNGFSLKYGTLVQQGDKEVFIRPPKKVDGTSNFTVDPANDKILVGSKVYSIVTYKEVNPTMGDDPILFMFYVRE